jgi:hypothetical protein
LCQRMKAPDLLRRVEKMIAERAQGRASRLPCA